MDRVGAGPPTPPRGSAPARRRPTRADDRKTFEGIVYQFRNDIPWRDILKEYGSGSTWWRRYQEWTAAGVWEEGWKSGGRRTRRGRRGGRIRIVRRRDVRARAKRGAEVGKTKVGNGMKVEVVTDAEGVPIGVADLAETDLTGRPWTRSRRPSSCRPGSR
jgi:transposase